MIGRILSVAVMAATVGIGGAASPAQAQSLTKSKNCEPPKYPGSGYFTSLKVTGVSCSRGREVTLAHYRCRVKKGKAGKCTTSVANGFRCSERRTTISTEINSVVTCKKGTAVVRYSYQQNT